MKKRKGLQLLARSRKNSGSTKFFLCSHYVLRIRKPNAKKSPPFQGRAGNGEESYSTSSSFLIRMIPKREIKKRTPLMTAAVTKTQPNRLQRSRELVSAALSCATSMRKNASTVRAVLTARMTGTMYFKVQLLRGRRRVVWIRKTDFHNTYIIP